MATITLRNAKGSPLTHTEVDDNFSSLKVGADIAEAGTSDNNPNTLVKRDAGGKAILSTLEATVDVITNSVGPSAAQQHTVPAVASDTLTLNAATQTLTNKTLTSPVISGGSIDNAPIGNTARSSGNFTTIDANSTITTTSTVQGSRVISTVATGTAPLQVTSTTKVANLNADFLDDMTVSSTNTANTVVNRDASGNFAAGTITATEIFTPRTGSQGAISGDRNRVINGSCQIVNVATFVATNNTAGYGGPEMFAAQNIGAGGQFTQSQGSLSLGGLTLPTVRQTVNTAIATPAATNAYWRGITQYIEGFNAFDLIGKPVALSFVFNTNVSGTYSVCVNGTAMSYTTTFSAVANTPQQVSIPFPAIPLAAGIPRDNSNAFRIQIGAIATNPERQTANVNVWQDGEFFTATGHTNWGATAGNFIELTNLQLEEGTVATPFIRRSYQQELAMTQRYFEKSFPDGVSPVNGRAVGSQGQLTLGVYTATGFAELPVKYQVKKRSSPTVTLFFAGAGTANNWRNGSNSVNSPAAIVSAGDGGFSIFAGDGAPTAFSADVYYIDYAASARL